MELLQLCWEDQNKLLFKFKKDKDDYDLQPTNVKSINLKFELSKKDERAAYIIQEPFLISIKDLHFLTNVIYFSIKLDKLNDLENLQINIIRLTIFYYSGEREEFFINQIYQLTDISYDDGEIFEITEEEVVYETKTRKTVKTKTINRHGVNKTSKNALKNREKKSTNVIPYKSTKFATNDDFQVSKSEYEKWLEIKGDKSWETTLFMVRSGYEKMKEMENEVKALNSAIKEIALKTANAPQAPVYLQAPSNAPISISNLNPPNNIESSSVNYKYNLDIQTADKVFKDKKDPSILEGQIAVMREMKEKFEKINDVKEILAKVPEDILKRKRAKTDHLSFIEFKHKKLNKERQKKIEILKNLGYDDKVEELTIEEIESKIELLVAKEKFEKDKN